MSFLKTRNPKRENAFSLAEVTLALGITVFCLVAIFGLLPVGIACNQTSLEQTAAAGVALAIASDLRSTPATTVTSASYRIAIPGTATQQLRLREDGSLDDTGGTNARYLAYVTFSTPAAAMAATPVRILITWPAAADLNNNPPINFAGSYEVFSALDRD